jgi:hypothetical protein
MLPVVVILPMVLPVVLPVMVLVVVGLPVVLLVQCSTYTMPHRCIAAQMPLGLQLQCTRAKGCIMLVEACWRQLLEKRGREGAVIVAAVVVAVVAANFW